MSVPSTFPIPAFGTAIIAIVLAGCSEPRQAASSVNSPSKTGIHATPDDERLKGLLEVGSPNRKADSDRISPRFRDVAASAGVRFQRFNDTVPKRYFLPEVMGGGVAWLDYDGDNRLDLFAINGCRLWDADPAQTTHLDALFRNLGDGRFEEVTGASGTGDNRYGQGCAVGDFNADGFPDLYVANYGRNTLLVNQGDGTFDDATTQAAVGDESWGTSAVWLDANEDDLADLYVVNYLHLTRAKHETCDYSGVKGYCGPGHWSGVDDVLYLNLGDGQFRVAAQSIGAETRNSKGLAVAACDFDDDGRPEIFVANDMAPNFLLTRLKNGATAEADAPLYQNIADASGCAVSGDGRNQAGMGVVCADFDGDGRIDIFMTGYYHAKNTLYRNLGGLFFEDDSRRTRIAAVSFESLGFGAVAVDYDHDGDDDLFVANGHVIGPEYQPYEMKQQLLENDGAGLFSDVSEDAGEYFTRPCLGRSVAAGDYDNDGRTDLAVSHLDRPLAVLRNETESTHHFIGFELLAANRVFPAGGRLVVTAGSKRRVIPIVGGGSYLSSGDPRVVVGLETYDGPVRVEVLWPGRSSEVFEGLLPGRYWLLREGQSPLLRVRS